MRFKDDENLIHIIQEIDGKINLISEIIVFGDFFKKKYQTKSISITIFDTVDLALDDLKSRTRTLMEIKESDMIKDCTND